MGGQSFAGYAQPFLSPLPPFFSIFIGFPDGSPSPTRYGWEEVLWQYSVSYNDTAARSSALTVRSPFLLRSLNGILVTYDGLTSHPRREAELLLKGISCHRNPDKLLCLTVKLNFWCLHLMISAFVFASEQLCKWRRLLSLFLLGCPWLWQDSSSRYLRPRLSSYSRGSAVWSVTAAKEDSPQWAYQNVVPQIRLVHNKIFLLDARKASFFFLIF